MTELAMTQASTGQRLNPSHKASSVLPNWLRPATIIVIVLAHIGVFAAFMVVSPPAVVSLDSLTMDLVQEGDFFEAEEVAEAEETPPPEVVEDPEFALPPPEVMSPDALTLPTKRDDMEKVEKKTEEQKAQQATQAREAQARRHAGAPEGRSGSGASQALCLAHVASDLRRHTPGTTSLGPGHAHVTFRINLGGGLSDINVSGSTPAHAALARRIVASSHGPGSCSSALVTQSFAFH